MPPDGSAQRGGDGVEVPARATDAAERTSSAAHETAQRAERAEQLEPSPVTHDVAASARDTEREVGAAEGQGRRAEEQATTTATVR